MTFVVIKLRQASGFDSGRVKVACVYRVNFCSQSLQSFLSARLNAGTQLNASATLAQWRYYKKYAFTFAKVTTDKCQILISGKH